MSDAYAQSEFDAAGFLARVEGRKPVRASNGLSTANTAICEDAGLNASYLANVKRAVRDNKPISVKWTSGARLAEALFCNPTWLLTGAGDPDPAPVPSATREIGAPPPGGLPPMPGWRPSAASGLVVEDIPDDVPILVAEALPPTVGPDDRAVPVRDATRSPSAPTLDGLDDGFVLSSKEAGKAARPPKLVGAADLFAFYLPGRSLAPKFGPSDLLYVAPHIPAAPGDAVLVELDTGDAQRPRVHHVGILEDRDADTVRLRQYRPDGIAALDPKSVARLLKIATHLAPYW